MIIKTAPDGIKFLWSNDYFSTPKTFSEIKDELSANGYNFTDNSLRKALDRAKFITKKNSSFAQKFKSNINFNDSVNILREMNIHPNILAVSEDLYKDGHYAQAIFEVYKEINIMVKEKSGVMDRDGKDLMAHVFRLQSPRLKWSDLQSQSDKDEQEGRMLLFMGAIVGIRNPKAHDRVIQTDPIKTLEYLAFASLLARFIDEAN